MFSLIDVGGGSVTNDTRNSLARISLRWMIRECFKTKTGILFRKDSFKNVGMDHNSLWPNVEKRPEPVMSFSRGKPKEKRRVINGALEDNTDFVSEEEEDLADALSPKNDMLCLKNSLWWWVLEFIPHHIRCPAKDDEDSWTRKFSYVQLFLFKYQAASTDCYPRLYYRINRKRGRLIPQQKAQGVKIHRTVELRIDSKHKESHGKLYKPRAGLRDDVAPTWID